MKNYKRIAKELCEGFLDMPCGCDGCPLSETGKINEEGNFVCELYEEDDEEVEE